MGFYRYSDTRYICYKICNFGAYTDMNQLEHCLLNQINVRFILNNMLLLYGLLHLPFKDCSIRVFYVHLLESTDCSIRVFL